MPNPNPEHIVCKYNSQHSNSFVCKFQCWYDQFVEKLVLMLSRQWLTEYTYIQLIGWLAVWMTGCQINTNQFNNIAKRVNSYDFVAVLMKSYWFYQQKFVTLVINTQLFVRHNNKYYTHSNLSIYCVWFLTVFLFVRWHLISSTNFLNENPSFGTNVSPKEKTFLIWVYSHTKKNPINFPIRKMTFSFTFDLPL